MYIYIYIWIILLLAVDIFPVGGQLSIGNKAGYPDSTYSGYVQHVRIWKRVFSPREVQSNRHK